MGWRTHTAQLRVTVHLLTLLSVVALLSLTACRSTAQPSLPAGSYHNQQYHFTVAYPTGWLANVAPTSAQANALTVAITRTSALQASASLVSTFTITAFNLHDPAVAASAQFLQQQIAQPDSPLHTVQLAGMQGYADKPVLQQIPNSTLSDTHTNYYLLLPDFEYHLSTDAVTGDGADKALQHMLSSFTIQAQ